MEPGQQDPVTLGLEHRVTMDQGSIERFMTQVTEQALEVVDLKRQWKEYEEAYALMEETVRNHVLEAKKKEEESDMKHSLETHVMMLTLEMQTEEAVAQHEELKQEVQVKKEELEARENELKKREEELEVKRKSLEVKEKNFEELMRLHDETMKEESTEIEKRNQRQEAEAREIEVKRHSLELKEKQLEEREELLKGKKKKRELDKRAKSRKRSRDELAEKDDIDEDCLIRKKHKHDAKEKDPEPYSCPDADFNSFNNNTISSSAVGQIWALYDPSDEMPRYYARIRKVLKPQLRVGIRWLESKAANKKPVPIACGEFKYGDKTTSSHLMFSHEMHHVRTGKKTVSINPRKGETWALFRDWKKEQQQHKRLYRYDFVQIESELDSDHGVGVAYLGKVVGFTSVYELAEQHDCFKMMIPSDEMLRFSHRVPSFVLTGDERKGVPAGSFELDPAAIPKDCLEDLKVYNVCDEFSLQEMRGMSYLLSFCEGKYLLIKRKCFGALWKISSAHDHDESEAQAEAIVKRNMGETRFLQRVTVEPVQPAGPVRWDEELVERCLSHATETATGMLDLSGQVREYKEMMVESVRKQSLEMEEKEKESDLRRSLEAELLMLVLEMQMVEEVVEREFRVREEKHEEREKVVRKLGENVQERCNEMEKREEEFQLKAKDVEVKRKELELKEKRREEQFQLRQDSEAKEIEAKMRSLERKEKELERKEKEFEELSKQTKNDDEADDDEDPEPYNCLDADFNNFNNTMSSFSVGQVWALYDPLDHMPRLYAKIKKVLELKMKVEVTWLESKQNSSTPIACGEFKYGERTIKSYLTFSHLMVDHTGKKKSIITINPRKGETWALFRDWKKQQQKRPYGYDFVQVVSELDSGGIGVAYLGRVEGFTSVYELGEQNGVLQMMVRCDEMLRFSHRVPSFVLTGDERKGVPAGSFELDPAAIPRDYLEASEVKQEE
ncbi:BnaC05g46870D [Brassica napus]|uniref:BnaC05g46870D protein n=1 Tax=Brassica napus TaxID=3708 RepID=A0A078HVQ9_BRANA|nr:BnaC05g46870D [Brassica napus]